MQNLTLESPENQALAEILAKMCQILLDTQAESQDLEENDIRHTSAIAIDTLDDI
jgi:hypothetical protein